MVISIATISVIGGLCLMGVGFANAFSGLMAKAFFLAGLVLLGIGWVNPQFVLPNPQPVPPIPNPIPPGPTPNPTPNPPGPTPTPASPYAQAFQLDRGTPEEAFTVAALYQKFADVIAYDGVQPQPKIVRASDAIRSLQILQQYYFLANPTPLNQRFPNLSGVVYAEMKRIGLTDPANPTLDAMKRSSAAQLFRDAGNSIALLGGQS